MPYLIDGHNLIPKVPGMSLEAIDDEDRLVQALQDFYRSRRQKIEVFFDQAPPARGGRKSAGAVVIHNVRQGKQADQAILDRLRQLGKGVRSWTVVTSDRQVRAGARELGASLLSSEEFAAELLAARREAQTKQKENPAPPGPDEIDEWLRLFRNR
jgi:uncharacterized protein